VICWSWSRSAKHSAFGPRSWLSGSRRTECLTTLPFDEPPSAPAATDPRTRNGRQAVSNPTAAPASGCPSTQHTPSWYSDTRRCIPDETRCESHDHHSCLDVERRDVADWHRQLDLEWLRPGVSRCRCIGVSRLQRDVYFRRRDRRGVVLTAGWRCGRSGPGLVVQPARNPLAERRTTPRGPGGFLERDLEKSHFHSRLDHLPGFADPFLLRFTRLQQSSLQPESEAAD